MKHDESSLRYVALYFHLPLALIGIALIAGIVLALESSPPPPCPCQPAEGEKTVLEFDGTCHVVKLGVGQLPQKR